jgi:hypothetical protein
MQYRLFKSVVIFVFISAVVGCKPPANPPSELDNIYYTGELSDTVYMELKEYLTSTTQQQLRDTIIIKYEYNKETCWTYSDIEYEDKYFINAADRIESHRFWLYIKRTGASIFHFREPGNDIPKIVKWDKTIIVDSTRALFKLLFSKKEICGNSILVTPDRRYIFFKGDSHQLILRLNPAHVAGFLEKKYTFEKFYEYLRRKN